MLVEGFQRMSELCLIMDNIVYEKDFMVFMGAYALCVMSLSAFTYILLDVLNMV